MTGVEAHQQGIASGQFNQSFSDRLDVQIARRSSVQACEDIADAGTVQGVEFQGFAVAAPFERLCPIVDRVLATLQPGRSDEAQAPLGMVREQAVGRAPIAFRQLVEAVEHQGQGFVYVHVKFTPKPGDVVLVGFRQRLAWGGLPHTVHVRADLSR